MNAGNAARKVYWIAGSGSSALRMVPGMTGNSNVYSSMDKVNSASGH